VEVTAELIAGVRAGVVGALKLLSDPAAQLQYERDVPIAHVPAELFCGWFDDSYHPDSPAHRAAFSDQEREALAQFHVEFESASAEIGNVPSRVSELQALDPWVRVVAAARSALSAIGEVAA
jgi:hypothetical protein